MSNERDRRSEDRLAEAYQALAEERAPDYLNEKVLRMAADTRSRYSRARAWMRPAAWAAVIGLSLAIVLDMTRLPQSDPDSIGKRATRQTMIVGKKPKRSFRRPLRRSSRGWTPARSGLRFPRALAPNAGRMKISCRRT